jgi:hypothetical protein
VAVKRIGSVNSTEKLTTAMHTAAGAKWGSVAKWIEFAQSDSALREAFRGVFGKRMPTPQKLGQWLSEHTGPFGELTLTGEHSKKRKAWAYKVAPTPAPRPTVTVSEAPKTPEPNVVESVFDPAQFKRNLEVPAPKPEYLTERKISRDGVITEKPILGRDGQPLLAKTSPAADTTAVSASTPGKPAVAGDPKPMTRVEQMRQRYLQHHSGGVAYDMDAPGGFANPGGIVGHNIAAENSWDINYCRVLGTWPGGRR